VGIGGEKDLWESLKCKLKQIIKKTIRRAGLRKG